MHCNVKTRCEALKALAQKKLGTDDPAVVEITRGGKNRSHHVLRRSDMKKVGLIAGGAFIALTALNVYSHYKLLIKMGYPLVAAHFFVFYFGIVADITPPVALAAYAGSAIAKSDPMKTGINATKLAIAAFIVPYIFAMNPSMLLMDQGVLAAIQVIITSCLGIFGIAAALEGYIVTRAPWWQRILLAAGGLCLIDPEFMTDVVGVAVIVVVIVLQIVLRKHSKPAAA